ncbi:calcium-binding protein, partial [Ruminococcus sp.]|uniref:calcium-binding protein n=1 Tax=Ruminococcus sp. TaxID=41978 RepID=UPI0025D3ECE1
MENKVSILDWINGWREAKGLSADETVSEEQVKEFVTEFKENFEFSSEISAKTLIYSENADEKQIAGVIGKYEEGTAAAINDLEEVKLISSDDFKAAVSGAVGEEWFERIYNGETVENVTTGSAFEGELAIRDFVYDEIIKNSSASEIVALVADDADDSVWNRTLLNETLLNENIDVINNATVSAIVSIGGIGLDYLGYSAERSSQVISEYIRAQATSYTDNSIIGKKNGEYQGEYLERVLNDGHLEKYAFLLNYITDINNMTSDIVYYLKQYGDNINDEEKNELLKIAGIPEEKLDFLFNAYEISLGDNYTYVSSYVKELAEKKEQALVHNEIAESDNSIVSDIVSVSDNTNQAFENITVINNNDNISNNNNNSSNYSSNNNSSNSASNSTSVYSGSTGIISSGNTIFSSADYSVAGNVTGSVTNQSGSISQGSASDNNSSNSAVSKLAEAFEGFGNSTGDAGNALSVLDGGVQGAIEGVRSYGLINQNKEIQSLLSANKPGALKILNNADEYRFRNLYNNGKGLLEGKEYIDAIGDGLTVVSYASETISHVINACTGEEKPLKAAGAIARSAAANCTTIAITEAAKPYMTFAVIPTVESFCAGVFGTTGAAAVAAPALLTAAAVIDLAFVANWAGHCVEAILDPDVDCHPVDIWVNDAEKIGYFFYDLFHSDDMYDDYQSAGSARYVVDPLIFDLGNDGFGIVDKSEGAYFDKDNNGYRERIDWTTTDAFLALDRNGNGKIDNGSELFGDTTYINGEDKYAENGFAALQQYDENGDGVINSEDAVFEDLRLWVDANGNGISEESELSTLADHDITSVSAVASEEKLSTGTSAVIDGTSTFEYADGTSGNFGALWATANYYDTKESDEKTTDGFNIGNLGNMPSLASALEKDDGTLQGYIDAFNNAANYSEKVESLDNILYTMSGAQDIDAKSRGSNIDARKLHVIETIMGQKFTGVNGENPNPTAANILKNMYNSISEKYYTLFNIETVKPYIEQLIPYETKDGKQAFCASVMNISIMNELLANPDSTILTDVCKYLSVIGINGEVDHDLLIDINTFFSYDRKFSSAVNKEFVSHNIYIGTAFDEKINGSGNADVIYGGAGNDTLYGGWGADELHGGAGNDVLYGSYEDDTYVFNLGDGQDIINEEGVNSTGDKVVFGEGIKPEDITVTRDKNDMVLLVGNKGDSLRIVNQFSNYKYQVESFEFADGTIISKKDYLGATITTTGSGKFSDPDDEATGITILKGSDEADEIYGNGRKDIIYGGAGNDTLYGGWGADELHGGAGNDVLYGSYEDDTYVFNLGD